MVFKPIAILRIFGGILLATASLSGQQWQSAFTWGGKGNESFDAFLPVGGGLLITGGAFTGQLALKGEVWTSIGEEDIYLAGFVPGQELFPVLHLGSPGEDVLSGLAVSSSGDLLLGGTFWQSLMISGTELKTTRNPKAIFVASYAPGGSVSGTLKWAKMIEGGSLKALSRIGPGPDGSIYLSGYFSDTLFIDTTALTAAGNTDAFLIKLDSNGKLLWATRAGGKGDVRALAFALGKNGAPAIAGIYNDQAFFGATTLVANTSDLDIFLASYTPEGALLWARKAGGVYDDEVFDMTSDTAGNFYLCGQLVGVMNLGNNLEIQSRDGNSDAFVLKYQPDGVPLWAKVLGGQSVQTGNRIALSQNVLALTGYFQGDLEWAGKSVVAGNTYNGFLALLDTAGQGKDLLALPGASSIFPSVLHPHPAGGWWVGGVYQGVPAWGGISLPKPQGGFDSFLAHWGPAPTASRDPLWGTSIRIYPNPASSLLHVDLPEIPEAILLLWNPLGQCVATSAPGAPIDASRLQPGFYVLEIRLGSEAVFRKILVIR
ncbi:MAG: T9SS type A sorting domain-containing protein [Haliscomenobacter sp.]|nr:T9SS type A sorting domain-containing protein [Haliscomenobacter sp.]